MTPNEKMIERIASVLKREDRFLVVTHVNPDGDAIGSLLGLHGALREMGKQSWPLIGGEFPETFRFLARCEDTLLDPGKVPVAPNWIISVDAAEANRISGDISPFRESAQLINMDHHTTNPGFGRLSLVDPFATSTAEVVHRVLKRAGYTLSPDVGKCLYTGIITDTGCFRFEGVDQHTLEVAAEMLAAGFASYEVTRPLFEEYPVQRLHLERLVLDRVEILLGGKLILSSLSFEDFERLGARMSESENLVNRLRETQGAVAGVLFTQISKESTRVSFRSKDELDVAAVAASFGGGGHRRAAGLKSAIPFAELKSRIVETIKAALDDQ
jgi:bifunctional oligoribonuclease and PAP phosphatase NrnA